MVCDCASLRAEIICQRSEINSQRKLMVQWFKLVMTEFQEVKTQNSHLISKFNAFKNNQRHVTPDEPPILEPSVSQPIPASFILEKNLGNSEDFKPLNDNPNQFGMSAEVFEEQETFKVAELSPRRLSTTIGLNAKASSDKFYSFGTDLDRGTGTISPNMDNHSLAIMGGSSLEMMPKLEKQVLTRSELFSTQLTKRFRCSECGYDTNNAQDIVRHRRTHTGERPFACDQCEFRASQMSILVTHRRTHTGKKPFQCDQCPYSSSKKANLQSHKKTHTGKNSNLKKLKPYQCDLCDYRTVSKQSIDKHRSQTH